MNVPRTERQTQEQTVLEALLRGERLTQPDIRARYHIEQPAARVFYLIKKGWHIETEPGPPCKGTPMVRYFMGTPSRRWTEPVSQIEPDRTTSSQSGQARLFDMAAVHGDPAR